MSKVAEFRVPPVVKSVRVRCSPEQAFQRFTRDIARWWPVATHSMSKSDCLGVSFEPHIGGRLVERSASGEQFVWGSVTAWEPPHRLVFTWHVGRGPEDAQQVELTFAPCADGTQVQLVHSGWDALVERGAVMRDEYDRGWNLVFVDRYARHAQEGDLA